MRGDLNMLTTTEAGYLVGRTDTTIRGWMKDEASGFRLAVEVRIPSSFACISLPKLCRFVFGEEDSNELIPQWRDRINEYRGERAAERAAS